MHINTRNKIKGNHNRNMPEKLIESVRRYEVLYNTKCKDYKDRFKRNSAWKDIGIKLSMTPDECREAWTKLRNAYSSALKRRRLKQSGQAAEKYVPWRYEDQMDFLRSYMETRPSISSSILPQDYLSESLSPLQLSAPPLSLCQPLLKLSHSPQTQSSRPESSNSNHSKRPFHKTDRTNNDRFHDLYTLTESSNEIKPKKLRQWEDMDETDYFFLSMSKFLKKLPQYDQATIKFDLHKAIHNAELRNIEKRPGSSSS